MKQPTHFIVVDDDPFNNMVSKYVIASVVPAASILLFNEPEKALTAILEDHNPAIAYEKTILFLDINMPTMSGWEFLDRISSFPESLLTSIAIYILSSSIDPKDAKSAEGHPLVQGYFSKPLTKDVLNGFLGA